MEKQKLTIKEIQARLLEMAKEAGKKRRDIINHAKKIFLEEPSETTKIDT